MTYRIRVLENAQEDLDWLRKNDRTSYIKCFDLVFADNVCEHLPDPAWVFAEVARVELIEGRPEYLRFSAPTYVVGWLYERLVNRVPGLARWRVLLVAELRKVT